MMDLMPYSAWFENKDEWGIFDEDGYAIGIKPDAPIEVLRAYEGYEAEYNEAFSKGILI